MTVGDNSHHEPLDGLVHQQLITGMIEYGRCLSPAELSTALDVSQADIDSSLRRLENNHGLVLHPHECSVWMIHPFSASPSHTWIYNETGGWWAPCMWCALGIAVLVGGKLTIDARIGGEAEKVRIPVRDGHPDSPDCYVHFALPPKYAWNNVLHFCAMLLPFKTEQQIDDWSDRHGLPRGQAVPIVQAAALARAWYGKHAESDYKKWTPAQAQDIFSGIGLTGPFWALDSSSDRF